MNCSIVVFPGSNCDNDISESLQNLTGKKPNMNWYEDDFPKRTDLIVLPGGFSFGDYLRSGAIASKSKIMKKVVSLSKKGVPIIGICNGFQLLTEARLLPGALILNNTLKFICKDVNLIVTNNSSNFSNKFENQELINLPIAHKMGNYQVNNRDLNYLVENNNIFLRYCSTDKVCDEESNPNGSIFNIAGILGNKNKILGMMPHPERFIDLKNKDIIMKKILASLNL